MLNTKRDFFKDIERIRSLSTVIDKKLISQVQDLKENKNLSITQIAKVTGRGRNTIYKVLKEELNYIPYNRLVKTSQNKLIKKHAQIGRFCPSDSNLNHFRYKN